MRPTFFNLLIVVLFVFSSCQRAAWRKQIKGLKPYKKNEFWYKKFSNNPAGILPKIGEEVRIDYTLSKGNQVLDHSYNNVYPILVQIPEERYDNFFTKALKLMAEGDSLRLLIPAAEVPELLGQYVLEFEEEDLVTFTYKMHQIKTQASLKAEILAEQVYLDSIRLKVPELISQFQNKTLPNLQKTPSGLSYLIFDKGTGAKAANGDAVSVHYICFSDKGKIVDDSYTNMVPLSFFAGSQSLIEGWSEGTTLLNQGGKALLFIPPNLAYGTQGNGDAIAPNSWVIFFIELMDVQKNKK